MKRAFLFVALTAAALNARAAGVAAVQVEAPRIIMPGAAFGVANAPGLIIAPSAPSLSVAPAPALIIPAAPVILAPAPMIVTAARPMTEGEIAPAKLPSRAEMSRLAESLAPTRGADAPNSSDADRSKLLDSAFDGKLAPEASHWEGVSERFQGPAAPDLTSVGVAARSLIARLLPNLYRRVPARAAYDRGENPATGHIWTPEKGHLIEIAPVAADSHGNVPSAFGAPRRAFVQQKIEHLLGYAHEYFHVLFDSAVGRKADHAPHSVYAAMTEGFAVGGEQLLIERLLDNVPSLGLGPRDAMDFVAIGRARREWLDVEDNHYSEGIIAWRKAYEDGGVKGLTAFLSSLSARRMAATPRSDPAYQLALGDHRLLAAYLGRDAASPVRRGLDAFAKSARGETLTVEETLEAAAAVEKAGPDGWRRLFDRTLLADKRIKEPKAEAVGGKWFEKPGDAPVSVEPVFALARLSPAAGAELSHYLAGIVSSSGGSARLFGRPGPNEKTNAIITGAESLPWDVAERKVWNDGLMRWLIGAN